MTTESRERTRTQAVEELFEGLLRFSRSLRARSADWGHTVADLTRSDVVLLGLIERGVRTRPGHLAAQLAVDPSVVSRQLVVLDRLGLIDRFPDPQDGRAELISATPQGVARLVQARGAMCEQLAGLVTDWDLDRINHSARTVEGLAELLQDTPDDVRHAPHSQTKEAHA